MPFTLNGTPLQRARVTIPRFGVWEGTCATAGELDVAEGAPVVVVLGDLTLNGYVVAGGTFAGAAESTYTIAGGAAGWSKKVAARGFSQPTGVRLVDMLAQLASDAGEAFDLSALSPTKILGDHWQRPAGPASVALSALLPDGWRVDPDGVARPGARPPAPLPPALEFAVEDAPRDRRWARIGISDDRASAFMPGAIVTATNLSAPLVVGELTVRAELEHVVVEVLGEGGLVELLAALVQALAPQAPLLGEYRYQVDSDPPGVSEPGNAVNLRALSPGVPEVIACSKSFGLPGVLATLRPNTVVLVSFADGSPARPRVTGYASDVAALEVDLVASTIKAGEPSTAAALALASPLSTWMAGVVSACAPHGITIPTPPAIATTNLLGS